MAGTVTYEVTGIWNAGKRTVYNYTVHLGTYSNTILYSKVLRRKEHKCPYVHTFTGSQCYFTVACAVSKTSWSEYILRRFKQEGFTLQQTNAQLCPYACRNLQVLRTANSMVFTQLAYACRDTITKFKLCATSDSFYVNTASKHRNSPATYSQFMKHVTCKHVPQTTSR
jgi:hypothetical protein